MKHSLTSVTIGVIITLIGFVGAFIFQGTVLAKVLYWQGYLLQNSIPAPNLGTPEHPMYEGTPIHVVAFFMGIPAGVIFYSLLAYVAVILLRRDNNKASGGTET